VKIFFAGPMSGIQDYNLPAFAAATEQLREPGHRGVIDGFTWRDYLRDSLMLLLTCEAVALLDGWETSRGAQLEVHVARALTMPIDRLAAWLSCRRAS